ncbi:MAG: nucleotide exchange factor GrpE [Acidobacteria bacterium]|nr:nucleotide exchange factor GrpE [Acidobacteriota bacterium]
MGKANGKPEVPPEELDVEHELPPAAGEEDYPQGAVPPPAEPAVEPGELENLKAERDALLDRLARQQAEFENARKRAARDQRDFLEYALADAVRALLPALDSLDRALEAADQEGELRAGLELTQRQFHDALAKLGVKALASVGQVFDPHVHQAVEMVDTHEAPDHTVLEELQPGYKLKDRLLRPAMVRVARNPNR